MKFAASLSENRREMKVTVDRFQNKLRNGVARFTPSGFKIGFEGGFVLRRSALNAFEVSFQLVLGMRPTGPLVIDEAFEDRQCDGLLAGHLVFHPSGDF